MTYNRILLSVFGVVVGLLFSRPTQAVTFDSPLTEGQLIYGQLDGGEKIYINGDFLRNGQSGLVSIPATATGRFVIGLPQDCKEITLWIDKKNQKIKKTFPVQKQVWTEEVVSGLPPAKVTPPADQQQRISAEFSLTREARQHSDFKDFPDTWVRPVFPFKRISSEFGSRRLLNGVKTQGHGGTDYAAPMGTPVTAPAAGRVRLTHPDMFYSGQTVMIDHGYGVFSSYSHLSDIKVKENQIVKSGDLIGAVGMSGRATGPHLHLTITWFGVRIDPERLFAD